MELTTGRSWPPRKVPDGRRQRDVPHIHTSSRRSGQGVCVCAVCSTGWRTQRHGSNQNSMALPRANCARELSVMTGSVANRGASDVVYPDFSKGFDIISHS